MLQLAVVYYPCSMLPGKCVIVNDVMHMHGSSGAGQAWQS